LIPTADDGIVVPGSRERVVMMRRVQINMKGEDLGRRIGQAIAECEGKVARLDDRITAREGNQPFDVRPEDRLDSLGELETTHQQLRDRVTQLTLLKDSLIPNETYALNKADLRYAGLISERASGPLDFSDGHWGECGSGIPIEGLKLTFSGEELRTLLEERRQAHEAKAARWRHELTRGPEDQTEDKPLLPDQMCENEALEEEWQAEVLDFIRDHIEAEEVYRLGKGDLEFGDLLPEKPGWMKQAEYEERTALAFGLERIAKKL
jgi:hypothetical protein